MNVTATYPDGSTREMPEQHAKILQHLGRATYRAASPSYMTRDMKAEQVVPMPVSTHPAEEVRSEESAKDLDSAGEMWDELIHVSTKLKNADGTWRKRPGARSALE